MLQLFAQARTQSAALYRADNRDVVLPQVHIVCRKSEERKAYSQNGGKRVSQIYEQAPRELARVFENYALFSSRVSQRRRRPKAFTMQYNYY